MKIEPFHRILNEPIAIIGMGCRFPGKVSCPESFWKLLVKGVDAITEVPEDLWSLEAHYHPRPGLPVKTYSRWGGFLDRIDHFEPECFGISPREASFMDPQQRLLLEVTWEALEDAGIPIHRLSGSATGVYVGISTFDYALLQSSPTDKKSVTAFFGIGNYLLYRSQSDLVLSEPSRAKLFSRHRLFLLAGGRRPGAQEPVDGRM